MIEPRVGVVQMGARHNYAYARALASRSALTALITDACFTSGSPTAALATLLGEHLAGAVRRRTLGGIDPRTIRANPIVNAYSAAISRFVGRERKYELVDNLLGLLARAQMPPATNVIINTFENGGSFLAAAKSRGIKIVTDVIITPALIDTETAEQRAFPEWEPPTEMATDRAVWHAKIERINRVSDILLCPSEAVAAALAEFPGFDPAKVRLMPYPLHRPVRGEPSPQLGRVLFAGAAGMRKGIHYLAEAAIILKRTHPAVEIVVAGSVTERVRHHPAAAALTFLQHLDREEMDREFLRADLFCLPSLAEGSAGVLLEAMSAGLPIVTTAASGSVIADGREGRIVPERNPSPLASAIASIVDDRALRARMAQRSQERVADFDMNHWGERIYGLVSELVRDGGISDDGQVRV